jgi:hypothetical protein
MQAQTRNDGTAKAITNTATPSSRTRPAMASHRLDLPCICDICGKARSTRSHQRCSKIRQQRKSTEWASYMENVAAKRAKGDRRYAH